MRRSITAFSSSPFRPGVLNNRRIRGQCREGRDMFAFNLFARHLGPVAQTETLASAMTSVLS